MDDKTLCENCKFWIQTGATDTGLLGECHRNPPFPVISASVSDGKMYYASWPSTVQNHWCGEFVERPMANEEVLKRMAMIKKLEDERKSK